jgi:DNA-binding MarR family transcriptional regulator
MFKGNKITLHSGQLLTGRKAIAKQFSIDESKVQRVLKKLEIEQQIEQQTSNENRLITILNWTEYQQSEQQIEQPVNNECTTSEQPVNTNKNVKNEKNEKNIKNNNIKENYFKTMN